MNMTLRSAAPEIASQLALLTDSAELVPSEIYFDEEDRQITIPMMRKEHVRKRSVLGLHESHRTVSPKAVESVLIVRDVLQCIPKDRFSLQRITLLFGVRLKENEVYLCSAEESGGISAFELQIKTGSCDIELRDRN